MREYFVEVETTVKRRKTVRIEAEDELKAKNIADLQGSVRAEDADTIECVTRILSVEENPYIDQYGNPYDWESGDSWPAGGGLHKDCDYNADALYAYYTIGDRYKIADYLLSKGFKETLHGDDEEVWVKGNTKITYECYDDGGLLWGYMHTELIEG